ncbi:LpqB family beta-propeller domain-containing protein [Streptomyces sp. NPDC002054]|uniref:LpqB family beta-propeller domain-containing protein n=1 Tax=Streptomyces sp. NPDC002054 TaxID=3154663 RepID=UPI00332D7D31
MKARRTEAKAVSVLALGGAGLMLAGCASMPTRGEVRPVSATQGADSQVRVYGVPPAPNASPSEIVGGFLEAMTSDDPQLSTARQYLTAEAAKSWKPGSKVTVLSSGLGRSPEKPDKLDKQPEAPRFKLTGDKVATVDERNAYQPEPGGVPFEQHLQLVREGNEWRISELPDGLVLSESDFQRIFLPVNKYYFASGTLVADPVYVRQRTDPDSRMDKMTQTVQSLLDGPSKWLGPVVSSSFPTGTALKEGTKSLSYDAQNTLRVPLNDKADNVAEPQCQKMATQLMYTVRDLTSSRVARVELVRPDKSVLCGVDESLAASIANRVPTPRHQYYIDQHKLLRVSLPSDPEQSFEQAVPVGGPLAGAPQLKVGTAAVAYEEKRAGVVSEDGHSLYTVSLATGGPLPAPVLTSRVKNGLSAPSWDGRGDLWVADRDPQNQVLWRIPGGTGTPQRVDVAGLDGRRIEELRISSDGVRIALLLSTSGARKELYIGRVERPEATGGGKVAVRELRPAAPQMADVTAMSWAPRGRLLVVGRESEGVMQARYMQADGSMVAGSLPGANGLTEVAASEDEKQPVVAYSDADGIVWLPPGAQWRTVSAGGSAPVYPG